MGRRQQWPQMTGLAAHRSGAGFKAISTLFEADGSSEKSLALELEKIENGCPPSHNCACKYT